MTKAQAFCKEVAQLAKKYDLPFFFGDRWGVYYIK